MRDTDADWRILGEFEPYYAVLSHERFLRRNLNEQSLNEFWQSGAAHVNHARDRIIRYFGSFQPTNAIDFGCGVGRLARGLASHCASVTGIDISAAMLQEARANALPNMKFASEIPDGPFDWINSAIVFQHIHPERGYQLFQRLLDVAAPDAVISVHFMLFKDDIGVANVYCRDVEYSTWDGRELKTLLTRPEVVGDMSMYDYNMNRILAMLARAGFTRHYLEHSNHGGCHGFEILGRRDKDA